MHTHTHTQWMHTPWNQNAQEAYTATHVRNYTETQKHEPQDTHWHINTDSDAGQKKAGTQKAPVSLPECLSLSDCSNKAMLRSWKQTTGNAASCMWFTNHVIHENEQMQINTDDKRIGLHWQMESESSIAEGVSMELAWNISSECFKSSFTSVYKC